MNPPPGIIEDDAILYGDLPHCLLAVGIRVMVPDLSNFAASALNQFYERLENFLGNLPEKYSLQVHSRTNSDYSTQLEAYERQAGLTEYDTFVRSNNHARFSEASDMGDLWNKTIEIYLSEHLTLKGSSKNIDKKITASREGMQGYINTLKSALAALGGRYEEMRNEDLATALKSVLNISNSPVESLDEIEGEDAVGYYYNSDTVSVENGTIYHAGRYHQFLTLRELPEESYPYMCKVFTSSYHKDISFTLLLRTKDKDQTLLHLENEYAKLTKDVEKNPSPSSEDNLEQLRESIIDIKKSSGGMTSATLISHVWSADQDSLVSKVDALKSNFASLRGARLYQTGLPVESRRLFYATFPGYCGDDLKSYRFDSSPTLASRLAPLDSQFKGNELNPMAIYQGDNKSLVGLSLFDGGRPLHTCIFGSSGAGKSVACNDLLTQINPFLSSTLIIEVGNSYGVTVKFLGGKSIELHPNGYHRMNIFDTHGSPLFPEDVNTMGSFIQTMCMTGDEPEEKAHIAKSIEQFLHNNLEEWKTHQGEALGDYYVEATHFLRYRKENLGELTDNEIYFSFKRQYDPATAHPLTDEEILDAQQDPSSSEALERYLFSFMKPEDFEILENYAEMLKHFYSGEGRDSLRRLGNLLDPWCGGEHGNLLNGHTNFDISGRLVQLELEGLGDNDHLKSVVLNLLKVLAFKDVLKLPRDQKKLWLFEELGSLSRAMSGLSDMAKTIAQTGRKYNLCLLTIVQQFEAFSEDDSMMKATIGNANQFIIFKQKSRSDLEKLLDEASLPGSLAEVIVNYVDPSDIRPAKDRYSSACLITQSSAGWQAGTMYIHCPKPVIWAADSSGENYQRKVEIINRHGSEAVLSALLSDEIETLELEPALA